jgi:hypothetical protein
MNKEGVMEIEELKMSGKELLAEAKKLMPKGVLEQFEVEVATAPIEDIILKILSMYNQQLRGLKGNGKLESILVMSTTIFLMDVIEMRYGNTEALREEIATLQRTILMMEE